MHGSVSPDPLTAEARDSGRAGITVAKNNGVRSPSRNGEHAPEKTLKSSPSRPKSSGKSASPGIRDAIPRDNRSIANRDDDDAGDSEAETLIDSPVKKLKQEAEKQNNVPKMERPPKHRIGSLPVPSGEDDDSANVSPAPSTVMSVEKTTFAEDTKDEIMQEGSDKDADGESDTGSLSDPETDASNRPSPRSLNSRAASERPDLVRNGAQSPNPRKRKHRASSVSLPNKRPSLDAPKRRLRGLHSEEVVRPEQSPSPQLRNHRRAVSTQSAFMDGAVEGGPNRKRRATNQAPTKEAKPPKQWEEESVSSETTSHGHDPHRPRRGVGRSTSTPGRPAGRKPKPHVNKYGFTKLAEACEEGNVDLVREWREKDPDQLELAEFAGNKPLQIAALNGNVDVVDYLIDQGCQIDCANVDKDTPLIDAAENGHLDVVNSLLKAGVDPLRQNLKGQQALDVVTDDTDDADEIRAALRIAIDKWNSTGAKQKREEEEEMRHRAGPSKELHFMARTYENLLRLVQINDRTGVKEFLDARVMVDNNVVAAAAKTGDTYLVNMLLAEITEKKALQKPEKPLLAVLGTSHFEMVKTLTELENFNPLWRNRQGKTWPEIAEDKHGPNERAEKELLERLYDKRAATKERRSSSPVTKRDSGKRRFAHRAPDEDESDEEERPAPRRKNGRKLMSKKELRAARGQSASDESSDESSSELPTPAEPELDEQTHVLMQPPGSSATKRTPTRSRTKSFSAQPADLPSPRTRGRSSSLRGLNEQALATVDEMSEDKDLATREPEAEVLDPQPATKRKSDQMADDRDDSEIEAHKRRQQEAETAKKRAAEEEAQRKAEQEQAAEEERKAEEDRRARAAEDARIAEEERERRAIAQAIKQREIDAAKERHMFLVLRGLPKPIAYTIDPASDFHRESDPAWVGHVWTNYVPVQVLKEEYTHAGSTRPTYWVANHLVAPLFGKDGLDLFVHMDEELWKKSLLDREGWMTKEIPATEVELLQRLVKNIQPRTGLSPAPVDENGRNLLPLLEQRQRIGVREKAIFEQAEAVTSGIAALRYLRLEDVLRHLQTKFPPSRWIDVHFDWMIRDTTRGPPPRKPKFARWASNQDVAAFLATLVPYEAPTVKITPIITHAKYDVNGRPAR